MSKFKKSDDYPTFNEVINTPRQTKLWQPFRSDDKHSKAEVAVANAGVLVAFALLVAMTIGVYAIAIWLTNLGCDTLIEMMPGCASFADLIGLALKVLATISFAWFMKICCDCVPYVVSKLRESADQVF
ncbi:MULTISPECIES: hypothetical protein [Pandoraea]|uniref:Uncharacterized protein n=2 Tax=Pandoraea TaxID=93217 RepID=A0A5E4XKB3_9BURK|nr:MULTISPECIES: hypothetical protein [Pandoraea]VVE18818.1 hypothetical protein PCE31107_03040 [Pandoraea cepalis]VVE36714.1 hypothetical protein PTE31013_03963 [Pandoraea terrigena]